MTDVMEPWVVDEARKMVKKRLSECDLDLQNFALELTNVIVGAPLSRRRTEAMVVKLIDDMEDIWYRWPGEKSPFLAWEIQRQ